MLLARSLAESQQPLPQQLALAKLPGEVSGPEDGACSSVLVKLAVTMGQSQLDVREGDDVQAPVEELSGRSDGCIQQPDSPASLSQAASSEQSGSLLDGPDLMGAHNGLSGLTAQLCG